MHVIFDPDSVDWSAHFEQMQTGGSAYFSGTPYQRGAGIGSIFGSLFRYLMPMLKTFGKEIGREGLSVGSRVLNDLASGSDVRNAVVNNASDGLRNLLSQHNVDEHLRGAVNLAQRKLQKGGGSKKKAIRTARRLGGRSGPNDYLNIYSANPRKQHIRRQ